MQIKYLGPSDEVNVAPHGPHRKGDVKEYPDDFAEELLATSIKQKFEKVTALPAVEKPEKVAFLKPTANAAKKKGKK